MRTKRNSEGGLVCKHRDLSVCPECVTEAGDKIVDVYGEYFLVSDFPVGYLENADV